MCKLTCNWLLTSHDLKLHSPLSTIWRALLNRWHKRPHCIVSPCTYVWHAWRLEVSTTTLRLGWIIPFWHKPNRCPPPPNIWLQCGPKCACFQSHKKQEKKEVRATWFYAACMCPVSPLFGRHAKNAEWMSCHRKIGKGRRHGQWSTPYINEGISPLVQKTYNTIKYRMKVLSQKDKWHGQWSTPYVN